MVLFQRFAELHPDGRQLCTEYLQRAPHAIDPHTGLMDLWIGFAGWMACVTGADFDATMVIDLGANPRMIAAFEQLRANDGAFAALLQEFSTYWPVYRSQDIVKHFGADYPYGFVDRAAFTATLEADQRVRRSPANWQLGTAPTWGQLIGVVYQVRCNLVHGRKSLTKQSDRQLVRLSFELLSGYIAGSGCIDWV
jgi:hypothetical protein